MGLWKILIEAEQMNVFQEKHKSLKPLLCSGSVNFEFRLPRLSALPIRQFTEQTGQSDLVNKSSNWNGEKLARVAMQKMERSYYQFRVFPCSQMNEYLMEIIGSEMDASEIYHNSDRTDCSKVQKSSIQPLHLTDIRFATMRTV